MPRQGTDAPKHTLDRAYTQLDKLTREQGTQQKVDAAKLDACIAKQDAAAIEVSKQLGTKLNVESTPTYFINGEKYEGALPLDYVFGQIDDALRAQGVTPPSALRSPRPSRQPRHPPPASSPATTSGAPGPEPRTRSSFNRNSSPATRSLPPSAQDRGESRTLSAPPFPGVAAAWMSTPPR